jgi:hypothetical protein
VVLVLLSHVAASSATTTLSSVVSPTEDSSMLSSEGVRDSMQRSQSEGTVYLGLRSDASLYTGCLISSVRSLRLGVERLGKTVPFFLHVAHDPRNPYVDCVRPRCAVVGQGGRLTNANGTVRVELFSASKKEL